MYDDIEYKYLHDTKGTHTLRHSEYHLSFKVLEAPIPKFSRKDDDVWGYKTLEITSWTRKIPDRIVYQFYILFQPNQWKQ